MEACNACSMSPADPIVVVPVLDLMSFDFSNLPGDASCPVTLRPAVPVANFYRVRLLVRVHATTMGSGQTFRFTLYNSYPSPVDPAKEFVDSTGFMTVDVTNSSTVPRLITGTGTDPDTYLKVVLTAIQGSAPATMKATLSASLLLRNGCSR